MLKLVVNSIFNKSNYICVSLILYLLRAVLPYLKLLNEIYAFLLVWGLAIIIYDLFTRRSFLKFYGNYLLTFFLLSVLITCLIHYRALYNNLYTLVGIAVVFYCIYTKNFDLDYKNEIKRITLVGGSLLSLINIVSIILALFKVSIPYNEGNSYVRINYIGISPKGQFTGLYGNPNYNAWYALLGLAICLVLLILIRDKKKIFVKILMYANLLLFAYTIVITQSRGGLLGLITGSFVYVFFYFYQKLNLRQLVKVIVCMLFAVVFCISIYYGSDFLVKTSLQTPGDEEAFDPDDENSINIFYRDSENKALNNIARIRFFEISVNVAIKNGLVFGIGNSLDDMRISHWQMEARYIAKQTPLLEKILTEAVGQTHNLFLAILLNNGIIALLIFISFLIYSFKKILILFSNEKSFPEDYLLGISLLATCISIITISMFENILIYPPHNALETILFAFFGLFLVWLSDNYGKASMHNKTVEKFNFFVDRIFFKKEDK